MTTSANEKDIKSVVGADGLLKLSAAYGGISFLILLDGNSLRRISAVIGQNKAEKFCQHFNGAKVYFPKQEKLKKEYRDRAWTSLVFDRIDAAQVDNLPASLTAAQVDTQITAKGYQTAAQVDTIVVAKGYQTAAQVDTLILAKGYKTTAEIQAFIIDGGTAAG